MNLPVFVLQKWQFNVGECNTAVIWHQNSQGWQTFKASTFFFFELFCGYFGAPLLLLGGLSSDVSLMLLNMSPPTVSS